MDCRLSEFCYLVKRHLFPHITIRTVDTETYSLRTKYKTNVRFTCSQVFATRLPRDFQHCNLELQDLHSNCSYDQILSRFHKLLVIYLRLTTSI